MLLYEVVDAFIGARIRFAVVGGYALALHGIVRATVDVDFVLELTQGDFETAELVLKKLGLQSRLPVRAVDIIKMRQEYIDERNLIAWSFVDYSNPSRQVDILITQDVKSIKTQKISVGSRKIPVATLQELLQMKQQVGRPQDLIDVETIKAKLNEQK